MLGTNRQSEVPIIACKFSLSAIRHLPLESDSLDILAIWSRDHSCEINGQYMDRINKGKFLFYGIRPIGYHHPLDEIRFL